MEQTRFKDIAHLYLGVDCKVGNRLGAITAIQSKGFNQAIVRYKEDTRQGHFTNLENIKPILRKLDSMTEEEHNQLMKICFNDEFKTLDKAPVGCGCPKGFAWLLYKHFDLFNLIESGEALDINEVKNK